MLTCTIFWMLSLSANFYARHTQKSQLVYTANNNFGVTDAKNLAFLKPTQLMRENNIYLCIHKDNTIFSFEYDFWKRF